jgi:transcriptional regulator with XRE-family HTH domain
VSVVDDEAAVDGGEWQDHAEERFAGNLRAARDRAGLSQQAVAAQMQELGFGHIRQQTIAQIEAGSRSVRLGEALALSRITGTSIDMLVRPQGLARASWRMLDAARQVREAQEALGAWGAKLAAGRQSLRQMIARTEEAGQAKLLADELYVARRAVAEDVLVTARLVMGGWLADVDVRPGRTLSGDERAAALELSEALRKLAEDEGPPESRQEAAARRLGQRVGHGLNAVVHVVPEGDAGESDPGVS